MRGENTPVIIGVAQRSWRERDPQRTPVDALEEVTLAALQDCGSVRVRGAIDALAHVPFLLTQEPSLANLMPTGVLSSLSERLGVKASQYGAVAGGNLPQTMINKMAAALVRGEHRVVVVTGVELLNSLFGQLRAGQGAPDWSTGCEDDATQLDSSTDALTAGPEYVHGLREPIAAYPLFETALRHASGRSMSEHDAVLGSLVSAMSRVAASNPLAWKQDFVTPKAALSTANRNRLICHPYTKLMNAIISVDMAASAVLTTAATARELGVPPEQWVYLWGSADANDTWYLSERAQLHCSPALRAASMAALGQCGLGIEDVALFDLYSCFPCAVQVACDAIGLGLDDPRGVTVTGGLPLFGGPGNNYSLHAIAEMVSKLRAQRDDVGMVTANGGYLTKHSVGLYSGSAPSRPWSPPENDSLQGAIDQLPHPTVVDSATGSLCIDAYTVRYEGDEPAIGIVLGTLADGQRCLAHTEAEPEIFTRLVSEDCVGVLGTVTPGADGAPNQFRF